MNDDHFLVVLQILLYFSSDLTVNQKDNNSINGKKKRIKSFLPHVQSLITQCCNYLSLCHDSPLFPSLVSTFLYFISSLMKSVFVYDSLLM